MGGIVCTALHTYTEGLKVGKENPAVMLLHFSAQELGALLMKAVDALEENVKTPRVNALMLLVRSPSPGSRFTKLIKSAHTAYQALA